MTTFNKIIATTLLSSLGLLTTTTHAANKYNCANSTGCIQVDFDNPKNDSTKTKYPVVLAHGLGGFTSIFGILDYWNGIPEALMEGGTENVFATKTSSFTDGEFRGEQLLQQVKTITALTGDEKVNLFGHSHGGSDIRYVAAVAPEYVASVTAVAAPAQGAAMADWIIETAERDSREQGFDVDNKEYNNGTNAAVALFNLVGNFMDVGSGIASEDIQEQDALASIFSLSTDYMRDEFNVKYPAAMPTEYCGQPPANNVVNDIPYYSFSGVGGVLNIFDPSDYLMAATAQAYDNDPNDGLVSACSSRVGYVIRDDYPMNHLDSVNQILGLVAWGKVNPLTVYRNQVNRLKELGK